MSEEAYSLIAALTAIAYGFVLYHRWQQGRALKRLKRLLEDQANAVTPAPGESPDGTPDRSPPA
jgi:hypothetical protein